MKEYYLTKEKIDAFASMLYQAEKSKATIEKYLRSIRMFSQYLAGNPVNKSAAITWKEQLQQQNNYAPSTVNAALAALNNLFSFLGWTDCRTHYLKIQRRLFRDAGQELCRCDYERLVSVAYETGQEKIALYHCGGCPAGPGRNLPQGKNPHDYFTFQTVSKITGLCENTEKYLRRDIPLQRQKVHGTLSDLGRDEAPVSGSRN